MLQQMQQQMQRQGIRRLLVLSGEAHWCQTQAAQLAASLSGDWVWIGERSPIASEAIASNKVHTLLGQQRLHAIFDATHQLNVEALAQLCGTLRAGSWLLLLVPSWQQWQQQPDADSIRWSDCQQPIATPHFIQHFQQQLLQDSEVAIWRQGETLSLPVLPPRADWTLPQGTASAEQQRILSQLLAAERGIWVLTGARGRGKSSLAGMLIAQSRTQCWITGPSRVATEVACQWAEGKAHFWPPDALLQHCAERTISGIDWLLIDEAAAIPIPLLQQLISHFPRVLLMSTVQGYEGTGRGFLLKFCAALPHWQPLTLNQPMRWAAGDALERVIDNLLLFDQTIDCTADTQPVSIETLAQAQLCASQPLLQQFYALLCSAHYRTSPLDLRRLMDAPGMHFACARADQQLIAALWLVEEGGIDQALAHEVWAGRRRPRGNLVAQSLAAHSGQWWAPTLRSRRITRVAVLPNWRQRGIASALIKQQQQQATDLDFLSVSFGYSAELWHFWQQCGFKLVRLGNRLEASSGCYTAMALLPLSAAGEQLCRAAHQQWSRDRYWLTPSTERVPDHYQDQQTLTEEDWRELAGFAFAHRPLVASWAALQRLLLLTTLPCTTLRDHLQQQKTIAQCITQYITSHQQSSDAPLTGQKALLRHWRQQVAQALQQLDHARCQQWLTWSQLGSGWQ
ncbi:tRNA(Met) cytidine acetyltransferase TmcA [Serratia microhaemolytica]|uniref:tRNA(Met) cytidine acetyltransferase TmcA n=1 Tax=Serratia microhaemolytica TaxID=2675110 RepID=UPI000FDDD500|nr:GNAT family N-acetyltransferase [Serratia microhaemolytica]